MQLKFILKIRLNEDDGSSADLLELKWKIMTEYLPLMGEDYVYEGADLPEAEMLIDQIQVSILFLLPIL